jgi:hypothetical protein
MGGLPSRGPPGGVPTVRAGRASAAAPESARLWAGCPAVVDGRGWPGCAWTSRVQGPLALATFRELDRGSRTPEAGERDHRWRRDAGGSSPG